MFRGFRFYKIRAGRSSGYSNSSRTSEAVGGSPARREGRGRGVSCQQLRLLSAPGRMLKQGEGWSRGGKLLRLETAGFSFSPLRSLASTAWLPSGPGSEQWPRSSGGRWMGTEHQGKGPSAQGRRRTPSPQQLPTEFTAQKTPLVHQLHVEVY